MEEIRVLRIIEYVGERKWVEDTLENSLTDFTCSKGTIQSVTIRALDKLFDPADVTEPEKDKDPLES